MLRIAITGVSGLLGWHLRCFLKTRENVEVTGIDKDAFQDEEQLARDVASCDVVIHFAGMNRGDENEVFNTNIRITEQLVCALKKSKKTPHVLFASSTQIYKQTIYGKSKIECSRRLQQWAAEHGGLFSNLILPNVFGECGKPFYNSVVSTFCYQIAHQQAPEIKTDADIEFLHAGALAVDIYKIIQHRGTGDIHFSGNIIRVSHLLKKIQDFAGLYENQLIPDLKNTFDRQLFNTYRSYLFPQFYPVYLKMNTDNRGNVFEVVKSLGEGQCFISNTKPAIKRGSHFHLNKFERFLVIKGKATIRVRKLFSQQIAVFEVDGNRPGFVDMPTMHVHDITNTGTDELTTLFWSGDIFNPDCPDTYMEKVEV